VRDLLFSINRPNLYQLLSILHHPTQFVKTHLVDTLQIRAQPSMHAEHAPVNHSTKREVVKHLAAPSPDVAAPVLALAFVVKAVHLRDLPGLVVASDERHPLRVAHLEGEQQQECLDAVETTINEVT
jgi:hypothetical protein